MTVQREIRDQVLSFEFYSSNCLSSRNSLGPVPITLLSHVEGRFADPMLAADLGHPGAALRLPQWPQDLLFRMSLLRHLCTRSSQQDHACLTSSRFFGPARK
jgi:hypothetical protein